jgi:hypothetical protein
MGTLLGSRGKQPAPSGGLPTRPTMLSGKKEAKMQISARFPTP